MSQYATIKAIIDQVVTTNGQQEITGALLNEVLKAMVDSLGSDYQYGGVVVPSSNVGTPDQNVFYIALQAGTYTNFGNTKVPNGITIFMWDGSWTSKILFAGDGGVFDITAYNSNTKYADLAAALGTNGANVPESIRKGGLSVKFVSSIDNKYVQARCMDQSFTTDVTQWQVVDDVPTAGSDNLVKSGGVFEYFNAFNSFIIQENNNDGNNDLKFADPLGQVILALINGGIKTKNFDSSALVNLVNTLNEDSIKTILVEDSNDFELSDIAGNVLLELKNGGIKTKNFDSSLISTIDWNNKNWFAYGTSLTAKQSQYPLRGVYADYVAEHFGMNLTNRGSGGSGMTTASDQEIYNRIMTLNDGKANADLITLECGANDQNGVIGNISDHSNNSTICGALNLILEYLQVNTHARIIVMSSWPFRYRNNVALYPWDTYGSDNHTWYDMAKAIEKVCNQNGVQYIPLMEECGMGQQARMNADINNKFMVDQIHPTDLGAYNVAQYLIQKIKNIPLWKNNIV